MSEEVKKEMSPEEQREQVKNKVIEEMRKKHTGQNGDFDVEGLLNDYFKRDEKLHYTRQEAKERRLKEEDYVKQLEEKAKQLKEKEEKEMLEQKKFEELIVKKDQEIKDISEKLSELDRLKKVEQEMHENQIRQIEEKVSTLSKESREIFDTAVQAMPENAYLQKLTLLEKLIQKPVISKTSVTSGGIENSASIDDPEILYSLKKTNPDLYYAKLREKMTN